MTLVWKLVSTRLISWISKTNIMKQWNSPCFFIFFSSFSFFHFLPHYYVIACTFGCFDSFFLFFLLVFDFHRGHHQYHHLFCFNVATETEGRWKPSQEVGRWRHFRDRFPLLPLSGVSGMSGVEEKPHWKRLAARILQIKQDRERQSRSQSFKQTNVDVRSTAHQIETIHSILIDWDLKPNSCSANQIERLHWTESDMERIKLKQNGKETNQELR